MNRQKGSETRKLIDHHLVGLGVDPAEIQGYDHEVRTHLEVGFSVHSNVAGVGIVSAAVSRLFGLSFIPVAPERFDMILNQRTYFHGRVQALTEVLKSGSFQEEAARLGGYDFKESGKILHVP